MDIAQNVLSFLRSSCTKEGHTYWLCKTPDDVSQSPVVVLLLLMQDVVRLFDLTVLCESSPFSDIK
jgi:hypothetical protein